MADPSEPAVKLVCTSNLAGRGSAFRRLHLALILLAYASTNIWRDQSHSEESETPTGGDDVWSNSLFRTLWDDAYSVSLPRSADLPKSKKFLSRGATNVQLQDQLPAVIPRKVGCWDEKYDGIMIHFQVTHQCNTATESPLVPEFDKSIPRLYLQDFEGFNLSWEVMWRLNP